MTFDEHVEAHRDETGAYDLDAAQKARKDELLESVEIEAIAWKAAADERRSWEKSQRERRNKVFDQPTIDSSESLEIHVPLYEGLTRKIGDLNADTLRIRKDRRATTHAREAYSYGREIQWIDHHLKLLGPTQTIRDLYE